jgi:hypothetical protein
MHSTSNQQYWNARNSQEANVIMKCGNEVFWNPSKRIEINRIWKPLIKEMYLVLRHLITKEPVLRRTRRIIYKERTHEIFWKRSRPFDSTKATAAAPLQYSLKNGHQCHHTVREELGDSLTVQLDLLRARKKNEFCLIPMHSVT